jgi:hypothetical protein
MAGISGEWKIEKPTILCLLFIFDVYKKIRKIMEK